MIFIDEKQVYPSFPNFRKEIERNSKVFFRRHRSTKDIEFN